LWSLGTAKPMGFSEKYFRTDAMQLGLNVSLSVSLLVLFSLLKEAESSLCHICYQAITITVLSSRNEETEIERDSSSVR
jgi:hypothetical protein